MRIIYVLLLFGYYNVTFSQNETTPNQSETLLSGWIDAEPEFPGGQTAMYNFLSENIYYPNDAKIGAYQGKVYVKFVIDTIGDITDVEILKGVQPLIDAEVVRVINMMPCWKPGYRGNVSFTLPIMFSLD